MTTFTTADRLAVEATILEGQTPTQTKYGRLYYETPYHGASIYLCDDGSYECTHGKEPELLCPSDHT